MNYLEHPTYLKLFNNYYRWVDKKFPDYSETKKRSFAKSLVEQKHGNLLTQLSLSDYHKKIYQEKRNRHNNDSFYMGERPSADLLKAQPGEKFKYVTQTTNKEVILECLERRQIQSAYSKKKKIEVPLFKVISKTESKHRLLYGGKAVQISDEDFEYWKMIFLEEQKKRPTD